MMVSTNRRWSPKAAKITQSQGRFRTVLIRFNAPACWLFRDHLYCQATGRLLFLIAAFLRNHLAICGPIRESFSAALSFLRLSLCSLFNFTIHFMSIELSKDVGQILLLLLLRSGVLRQVSLSRNRKKEIRRRQVGCHDAWVWCINGSGLQAWLAAGNGP